MQTPFAGGERLYSMDRLNPKPLRGEGLVLCVKAMEYRCQEAFGHVGCRERAIGVDEPG